MNPKGKAKLRPENPIPIAFSQGLKQVRGRGIEKSFKAVTKTKGAFNHYAEGTHFQVMAENPYAKPGKTTPIAKPMDPLAKKLKLLGISGPKAKTDISKWLQEQESKWSEDAQPGEAPRIPKPRGLAGKIAAVNKTAVENIKPIIRRKQPAKQAIGTTYVNESGKRVFITSRGEKTTILGARKKDGAIVVLRESKDGSVRRLVMKPKGKAFEEEPLR